MSSVTEAEALVEGFADEALVNRGRAALESYVLDVLFNPANRDGARFRGECLAWRDPEGRDALKRQLLAAAATWNPGSGWERYDGSGDVTYSGRLVQFYTTIRFDGSRDPEINVEVD